MAGDTQMFAFQEQDLSTCLHDISDDFGREDLESFKFLCKDLLSGMV